jgi:glycosyltransferase involved in cell wall biosynthesis
MTRRHTTIDVTVMICTWNNGVQLDRTLATLGRCRIPTGFTWEVVVVNNDSSEATDRVVARHRHTLPLVLEHEPLTGLSRARNRGLQVARGNLIVFTDDDVTVNEGWLEAYWEAYAARPDCFLGGRIRSQFGGQPPDPRVLRFAPPSVKGLDYGPDRRLLEPGEYFIGPNWACPRCLLNKVGAFDESRGLDASCRRVRVGEETNLMRRLQAAGASALYLPEAMLDHHVPPEKSTLTHVAQRAEATAYDAQMNVSSEAPVPAVLGYPRWRVRNLLEGGMVTAWRLIVGGDWIASYVEARRTFGVLRATRDLRKHRARAVPTFRPTSDSGIESE